MNNKNDKIFYLEFISLIFSLIFSFVNHFLYQWTNEFFLLAPFVAINESVWEHGKLLFMPFLFYSIIEYFLLKDETNNFLFAKSLSLIISIPLMIILFYTYSGVLGQSYLIFDILIAIIVIVFMNILSYKILKSGKGSNFNWIFIFVIIIFALIILFTYMPPDIPLFQDITTN